MPSVLDFDALGAMYGLRYSGQNRKRSTLGGTLTIIVFIVSLITIAFFFNLYISGSEFTQIVNSVKFWDSQTLNITSDFQIGLLTRFSGEIMQENNIWALQADFIESDRELNSYKETPIKMTNCTRESWENIEEQFTSLKINQGICFITEGLSLVGNYYTNQFKYILYYYS